MQQFAKVIIDKKGIDLPVKIPKLFKPIAVKRVIVPIHPKKLYNFIVIPKPISTYKEYRFIELQRLSNRLRV
jgi:hypothetical protein